MKVTAIISLVLTSAATITSAQLTVQNPISDADLCSMKNNYLFEAIADFCQNTDIVVPSAYAANGKTVQGQHVRIQAACNNMNGGKGVWVPQRYCFEQLWTTCARGDSHGRGTMLFGSARCQRFQTNP